MNKSIILFCCLLLLYSKAIYSQEKISIQFSDQSLLSALYDLEQASAFRFVFQDIDPEAEIVNGLEFEQVSTFQILNTLLAETGFDFIVFRQGIDGFWVVVYKVNISTAEIDPVLISVTGKVNGEWGPQIGAVLYKIPERQSVVSNESVFTVGNHNILAVTGMNGSFFIPSVEKNAQILVSMFGYLPRVVPVKEAEQIKMERDTKYDDVIIRISR